MLYAKLQDNGLLEILSTALAKNHAKPANGNTSPVKIKIIIFSFSDPKTRQLTLSFCILYE